jgi:hypothetical protein
VSSCGATIAVRRWNLTLTSDTQKPLELTLRHAVAKLRTAWPKTAEFALAQPAAHGFRGRPQSFRNFAHCEESLFIHKWASSLGPLADATRHSAEGLRSCCCCEKSLVQTTTPTKSQQSQQSCQRLNIATQRSRTLPGWFLLRGALGTYACETPTSRFEGA